MFKILLTLSLLAPSILEAATVYKHVGPDGRIIYSDVPAAAGSTAIKGAQHSTPSGPPADLVAAASAVGTTAVVVDSILAFCRVEVPESAPGVLAAAERWKAQHASLRAKSASILAEKLTPQERQRIDAMLRQENEKITGQLRQVSPLERKRMCEGAPGRLASPEMHLAGQPGLVRAIMDYRSGR